MCPFPFVTVSVSHLIWRGAGGLETATTGNYLLILNASQRAKHAEGNMFLYEQSPELRVSTVLLKGHVRCPHKDTVHYTHTAHHTTMQYSNFHCRPSAQNIWTHLKIKAFWVSKKKRKILCNGFAQENITVFQRHIIVLYCDWQVSPYSDCTFHMVV